MSFHTYFTSRVALHTHTALVITQYRRIWFLGRRDCLQRRTNIKTFTGHFDHFRLFVKTIGFHFIITQSRCYICVEGRWSRKKDGDSEDRADSDEQWVELRWTKTSEVWPRSAAPSHQCGRPGWSTDRHQEPVLAALSCPHLSLFLCHGFCWQKTVPCSAST